MNRPAQGDYEHLLEELNKEDDDHHDGRGVEPERQEQSGSETG